MSDTMTSVLAMVAIFAYVFIPSIWSDYKNKHFKVKLKGKYDLNGNFPLVQNCKSSYLATFCINLGLNPSKMQLITQDAVNNSSEFFRFQQDIHNLSSNQEFDSMSIPISQVFSIYQLYKIVSINNQRIVVLWNKSDSRQVEPHSEFSFITPVNFCLDMNSKKKHPVLKGILIVIGIICVIYTPIWILVIGFICGLIKGAFSLKREQN